MKYTTIYAIFYKHKPYLTHATTAEVINRHTHMRCDAMQDKRNKKEGINQSITPTLLYSQSLRTP